MDATTNYSLEFYSTFKPDLMNTQHPDLIGKISQRMQPNGWSQVGFLAPEQDLVEICQKDAEILKARGITHAQIADRLEAVIMKANHLFRQLQDLKQGEIPQAIIEDKLCVPSYISTMGHQECPFTQDPQKRSTICGKGSSMITIINQTSKKQIDKITELHAHLIRDHHFFEGKAPYRLDPELAIEVLGLEPNRDYKVETVSQDIWSTIRGCSVLDEDARAAAKQDCIESIVDENGVFEAYLLPYKDWNIYKDRALTNRQVVEKRGVERGKTSEEIQKDLATYSSDYLDQQAWTSDGENYLHIFKFKKITDKQKTYYIGNVKITGEQIDKEVMAEACCKIRRSVYPVLSQGDRIEIVKKGSWF